MTDDGPLTDAFENIREGVIKQKLITLFIRNGSLVEETVERDYTDDGDYIDSITTETLVTKEELIK
jgi:hypothetical protein